MSYGLYLFFLEDYDTLVSFVDRNPKNFPHIAS